MVPGRYLCLIHAFACSSSFSCFLFLSDLFPERFFCTQKSHIYKIAAQRRTWLSESEANPEPPLSPPEVQLRPGVFLGRCNCGGGGSKAWGFGIARLTASPLVFPVFRGFKANMLLRLLLSHFSRVRLCATP